MLSKELTSQRRCPASRARMHERVLFSCVANHFGVRHLLNEYGCVLRDTRPVTQFLELRQLPELSMDSLLVELQSTSARGHVIGLNTKSSFIISPPRNGESTPAMLEKCNQSCYFEVKISKVEVLPGLSNLRHDMKHYYWTDIYSIHSLEVMTVLFTRSGLPYTWELDTLNVKVRSTCSCSSIYDIGADTIL